MATELKSDFLFDHLRRFLETDEGTKRRKKINFVYRFNIAPKKMGIDEVTYTVNLKTGEVIKGPYEGGEPDATFHMKDEDFINLVERKMNPQMAFMRGAVKIKGNLSAATKFTLDIFPKPSKL
ncbi:sterol carrier protein 2 [Manihot esculenta]|uniref:SCP2 domain-containing protein n=1 Tax=Manihot esculenta TaxID=3983 RepID=A0A2C9U007_MANES|nr:sterol carrier protein 2 [Manihot esculenta]OAY22924.1 hypothetical protein MANES_18G037300v8 [Manihot esculenta]